MQSNPVCFFNWCKFEVMTLVVIVVVVAILITTEL